MVTKRIKRRLITLLALAALALGIFSLVLLGQTAQSSVEFGRLHTVILFVDIGVAVVLLTLIVSNLVRLLRDYQQNVPGARLRGRMVMAFIGLAVAPLVLVFLFAVQFLNRGIDSWFDVQVEEGLTDALRLSQSALEMAMREDLERTLDIAAEIYRDDESVLYPVLGTLRREAGAFEATVFGENFRIIATSSDGPVPPIPTMLNEEVLLQLRLENTFVGLEPQQDGNYFIRAAVALPLMQAGLETRVLQVMFLVGDRIGSLAESVQRSYTRYGELVFLRGPLKNSFTLTLSVVVLLSLLTAVYGAFFFARRLVAPIQHLVAGTRSVAEGDFDTRLPMASKDEIGILIDSFNEMIERLGEARAEARRSEQQVENERASLEVILARLSTGVVAFAPDLTISIANEAAATILGVELNNRSGKSVSELAADSKPFVNFVNACRKSLDSGETEWRDQIVLRDARGKRVLTCACSALPGKLGQRGGLVVVFDDITNLLRAQKDAAWREVARRLAHEIKNPLTPIQLSAERLRRKYLGSMQPMSPRELDRATSTIVQQVEAMRDMVNAFSEYARAPEMTVNRINLNQLIIQVADLYPRQDSQPKLTLSLDHELPDIDADAAMIRQVMHNLIRNAMEAMEGQADAEIQVATRQIVDDKEDMVEVSVSDDGPGFRIEALDDIFEPYVTTKPKGTGLGLAIVKKLIEEHGGNIWIESTPADGACVRFQLPVTEADATSSLSSVSVDREHG